jgi:hypothetical protein
MKIVNYILVCIIVLFSSPAALAQKSDDNELIRLSGTILSSDSLTPVAGVHVLNNRDKVGTSSNEGGYFSIPMHRTDTVLFSAVGYETYQFVLEASSRSMSPLVTIKLIPKIYELKEVSVSDMPTEDQFKKDLLALKLPDEPNLDLPQIKQPKLTEGVEFGPNGGLVIPGPFSALHNKFSREAKERKKVQVLQAQEFRNKSYNAKFNAQVVQRVTGLKDEQLDEFMKYCKLNESLVLNAKNEYEIALAINNCLKEYKEMKGMN